MREYEYIKTQHTGQPPSTAAAPSHLVGDSERSMSLRPSDFVPEDREPPALDLQQFDMAALHTFEGEGDRHDVLAVTVPLYVWHALGLVGDDAYTTRGKTAMFCLARGLERFGALREVAAIRKSALTIRRRAFADVAAQLSWHYRTPPRGGSKRLFMRAVTPSIAGQCADIAESLGLSTSDFGALAIMAGLMDAPTIEGDHRRLLVADLRDFHKALKHRVPFVGDIARRASAHRAKAFKASWFDVIRNGQTEE